MLKSRYDFVLGHFVNTFLKKHYLRTELRSNHLMDLKWSQGRY